ncbi:MAG: hypothetical protein ACI9XO_004605 [Paraglaciecola sp.]|jgi:hypothetical protein
MMTNQVNQLKKWLPFAALLFAIWGIITALDFQNHTYTGFRTDAQKNIISVEENSPAALAGMQVGDVLTKVDGIGIDDWSAFRDNPRPLVGEIWAYEVSRNGEIQKLNLTFAPESSKNNWLSYLGVLVGFIFLLTGFWIARSHTSTPALYFSFFAIFFSMIFFSGPYFANGLVRDLVDSVELLPFLTGLVGLIYFLLNFPTRSSFLDKKQSNLIILAPAVLMAVVIIGIILLRPDANSGIRNLLNIIKGVVPIFYFGWALVLLFKKVRHYSAAERNEKGINFMLWGALLGFVPILIVILTNLLAPKIVLPGGDYAFLTFGFLPILFAFGIQRLMEGRESGIGEDELSAA